MKKKIIFVLFTAAAAVSAIASAVSADTAGTGFDYSAEKMECSILPPAINADEAAKNRELLGAVNSSDWSVGPEDAVLTIIEYADFQCPYCADASLNLVDYQSRHRDEVRLVYRHFPLSFHEKAVPAALAANAAGYQGMFFEAERFLFERQNEWSGLESNEAFREWLIREFGNFSDIDFDLWYLAFSDSDKEAEIRNMYSEVIRTGIVSGTPTVFLNYADSNYMFDGSSLDAMLGRLKAEKDSVRGCPGIVITEGSSYTAILETESGNIRFELFADTAPNAVNSFKFLAEQGWYDETEITADYNGLAVYGEGRGIPGYGIGIEFDENRLFEGPGYIGFDGSQLNENAGRFFITNDIRSYFENRIMQDIGSRDISEEAIRKYAEEKIIRFSRRNTVFGRILEEDMDKLNLLKNGTLIRNISIVQ